MSTLLTDLSAWVLAILIAVVMLAGWGVGWWTGQRLPKEQRGEPSKFNDAILAILGLLLGFTFAMSLGKHEQRRQMVLADSNAIGDFYTCASLLPEPQRTKLQGVVHQYVEHRLAVARERLDEAALREKLREAHEMQDRMQALVGEAVDGGSPVTIPLVNTFNALTSNHAARLAAVRDRLPGSIVLLLVLTAVMALVLVGRQQRMSGERHFEATLGFILLVSMVIWVTLDLNQPQRGAITVSQEPLERLLAGMGK